MSWKFSSTEADKYQNYCMGNKCWYHIVDKTGKVPAYWKSKNVTESEITENNVEIIKQGTWEDDGSIYFMTKKKPQYVQVDEKVPDVPSIHHDTLYVKLIKKWKNSPPENRVMFCIVLCLILLCIGFMIYVNVKHDNRPKECDNDMTNKFLHALKHLTLQLVLFSIVAYMSNELRRELWRTKTSS